MSSPVVRREAEAVLIDAEMALRNVGDGLKPGPKGRAELRLLAHELAEVRFALLAAAEAVLRAGIFATRDHAEAQLRAALKPEGAR